MKHRLPTMYERAEEVQAGGLVSYGINSADMYRRAATYVDKILKGRTPAELPVEQPTKFELIVNLKAARADRADDSTERTSAGGPGHKIAWSKEHGAGSRKNTRGNPWEKNSSVLRLALCPSRLAFLALCSLRFAFQLKRSSRRKSLG